MAAVVTYSKVYDVETEIVLPKTQIVVGTEAMHAGVSSNFMKYCMYCGIPPTLHVLMQTMGRVDRRLNPAPTFL